MVGHPPLVDQWCPEVGMSRGGSQLCWVTRKLGKPGAGRIRGFQYLEAFAREAVVMVIW